MGLPFLFGLQKVNPWIFRRKRQCTDCTFRMISAHGSKDIKIKSDLLRHPIPNTIVYIYLHLANLYSKCMYMPYIECLGIDVEHGYPKYPKMVRGKG